MYMPLQILPQQHFNIFSSIYFWLHWFSLLCEGFLQVWQVGGCYSLWCSVFSLRWFLLWSTGSAAPPLQWLQLPGSGVSAHQLWHLDLVAPRHVGSSRIRDRSSVPSTGRQSLSPVPPARSPNSIFTVVLLDGYPYF